MPTLFVSHGAPLLPLSPIPARDFLTGLGSRYPDAKSVLCISAHWETPRPAVSAAVEPETIHDFYGFPPELYRITYPARGAPISQIASPASRIQPAWDATSKATEGLTTGHGCPLC